MWRANVARDERLIGELATEREAQLAQLDRRATGSGDLTARRGRAGGNLRGGATVSRAETAVPAPVGPRSVARHRLGRLDLRRPAGQRVLPAARAGSRKDATTRAEARLAGRSWAELTEAGLPLPPCSAERAGLMSPQQRNVTKDAHPYAAWYEAYRKFRPTSYDLPAYSADCVPFRWMLRAERRGDLRAVPVAVREPPWRMQVDSEAGLHATGWVQHESNQRMLLDTFFSAVEKDRSLFFVYAKESPISSDPRRILIGAGQVRERRPGHPVDQ